MPDGIAYGVGRYHCNQVPDGFLFPVHVVLIKPPSMM
jgi:hypothetical protein